MVERALSAGVRLACHFYEPVHGSSDLNSLAMGRRQAKQAAPCGLISFCPT